VGRDGEFGDSAIYDVTDPVHPRLLCRITFTSANLSGSSNFEYLDPRSATDTNIAVKPFAGGTESSAGALPGWVSSAAWLPNGSLGAYTTRVGSYPNCPSSAVQVWAYRGGSSALLTTYCVGIGDCICRFGLPGPVLAFSPDGQYLVEGLLSGKGSTPMGVFRLADHIRVATLPINTDTAFWDRSTDRLFEVFYDSVEAWTPDGTTRGVAGAANWSYDPNVSPDGAYVAYTTYLDQVDGTQPRVYVYEARTSSTRMLVNQPRSQVIFIKDGWVWYLEEQDCSDCPNLTQPSDKVFAMNLSTGVEQQVIFAAGEAMTYTTDLLPGEFWPNS